MTALFLFDIDGTLILSGRAGVRGMNRAFERLYGRAGALDGVPIAGRTDRAIVSDVLRALGRDAGDDEIGRLRDAYCDCLPDELQRPVADPSGILPGVEALLDRLASEGAAAVGLLTGNFARGASIKLGHFGLADRFAFGAFGDDHLDRRDLVPIAIDAARRAGAPVSSPAEIVVVGDTPLDVECAHAHRARAVGVATGPFAAAALKDAGADLVLETLAEQDRLLAWATA
ncbi:MAG TPA: HAD family hydrolase [Vicinamibacterales bacterium]|nr:HAD family hydrolase [Vicinamibacterales bacterium]